MTTAAAPSGPTPQQLLDVASGFLETVKTGATYEVQWGPYGSTPTLTKVQPVPSWVWIAAAAVVVLLLLRS